MEIDLNTLSEADYTIDEFGRLIITDTAIMEYINGATSENTFIFSYGSNKGCNSNGACGNGGCENAGCRGKYL